MVASHPVGGNFSQQPQGARTELMVWTEEAGGQGKEEGPRPGKSPCGLLQTPFPSLPAPTAVLYLTALPSRSCTMLALPYPRDLAYAVSFA